MSQMQRRTIGFSVLFLAISFLPACSQDPTMPYVIETGTATDDGTAADITTAETNNSVRLKVENELPLSPGIMQLLESLGAELQMSTGPVEVGLTMSSTESHAIRIKEKINTTLSPQSEELWQQLKTQLSGLLYHSSVQGKSIAIEYASKRDSG